MEDLLIQMVFCILLKNDMKNLLRLFLNTLFDLLLVSFLVLTFYAILLSKREHDSGEPQFFLGYKTVLITSGSMEDTISKGDLVLVKEIDGTEAAIGDILFFRKDEGFVVHRYVGDDERLLSEGNPAYMITKGDNNDIEDIERLDPEDVFGRVIVLDKSG